MGPMGEHTHTVVCKRCDVRWLQRCASPRNAAYACLHEGEVDACWCCGQLDRVGGVLMDKPRIDLTGREFIEWNRLLKVEFHTDEAEIHHQRNVLAKVMDYPSRCENHVVFPDVIEEAMRIVFRTCGAWCHHGVES